MLSLNDKFCANSAKLKKKEVNSVYDENNSKPCLTKQLLNRFMLGMIGAIVCHFSGEKVRFFRIILIILQEEKGVWERGCSAR